jgi:hypothetical protein
VLSFCPMFMVSDAEAAAIRAAHERAGDTGATAELLRLFPGVADYRRAREFARAIAAWQPLPPAPAKLPRLKRERQARIAPPA